jgi:hypothetical protein
MPGPVNRALLTARRETLASHQQARDLTGKAVKLADMHSLPRSVLVILFVCLPALGAAQTFDTVGTRAAGMAGAFVAVADDASAAYWNPAGFAAGNLFTMVVDRSTAKVNPGGSDGAASRSGVLVSLGMPALAISYYRLHSTTLTPQSARGSDDMGATGPGEIRLDTLITHHSGATLVQSIGRGVAVGATLKLVRGVAASSLAPDVDRGQLLSNASELGAKGTSKFDADIGVMAALGTIKIGLTVRNLTDPDFAASGGSHALTLRRHARAGVALTIAEGWAVAADLDLTREHTPAGLVRTFAAGTEGRIGRKAFVRGGLRLNTVNGRGAAAAAGASYSVMGPILIDAHLTAGSDQAQRGWGVAARVVY